MTALGSYFLLSITALSLLTWATAWIFAPSKRAKQWLLATVGLFIPLAVMMVTWWPWPWGNLSLLPGFWTLVNAIVVLSLIASASLYYLRQLSRLPFSQPIQLSWLRYLGSLAAIILVGQLARSLPWSTFLTISICCVIVGGLGYVASLSPLRQLIKIQLLSVAATALLAIILGTLAAQLSLPLNYGLGWGSWHIIWIWPSILTLLALALAWPTAVLWWLQQTNTTSNNHYGATS